MLTGYFARLKTYIGAGLVPVSIAAKAPSWYKGLEYKKLATDMVVVLGNNPYMAKAAMMSWITKMGDAEEQVSLLALADNITKRLLEIKPEEWE